MGRLRVALALAAAGLLGGVLPLASACPAPGASSQTFSCPMHPEVRQPGAGTCPSCGMDLTPLAQAASARHACPMHPAVQQDGPGRCPSCGMDLVPQQAGAAGAVVLDENRRAAVGVRTVVVASRALARTVRAPAKVAFDESLVRDVTIRAAGYIEDLRAQQGLLVKKGETLAAFLSPELTAAQNDYLRSWRGGLQGGREDVVKAARQRLLLLGMTEGAIEAITKSGEPLARVPIVSPLAGVVVESDAVVGALVEPGARVFRVAGTERVYVDAEIAGTDISFVHKDARATVIEGGRLLEAKVVRVLGSVDPGSRTGRARVELVRSDVSLLPGTAAVVEIDVETEQALAVPVNAVLYTGRRRVVFVDDDGARLVPREVVLGRRSGDHFAVLSGLAAGDRVATDGAFLLASESRMMAPDGPMNVNAPPPPPPTTTTTTTTKTTQTHAEMKTP
jgi:Cu(I)/Ag(I) efflux system membrane fusion protein